MSIIFYLISLPLSGCFTCGGEGWCVTVTALQRDGLARMQGGGRRRRAGWPLSRGSVLIDVFWGLEEGSAAGEWRMRRGTLDGTLRQMQGY